MKLGKDGHAKGNGKNLGIYKRNDHKNLHTLSDTHISSENVLKLLSFHRFLRFFHERKTFFRAV